MRISYNKRLVIIKNVYEVSNCRWREGITVDEYTTHPSNIKTWPLINLLLIHLKQPQVDWFGICKINFNVKSNSKDNLTTTYCYFKVFMLDEWEVHSYTTIIFSLHLPSGSVVCIIFPIKATLPLPLWFSIIFMWNLLTSEVTAVLRKKGLKSWEVCNKVKLSLLTHGLLLHSPLLN